MAGIEQLPEDYVKNCFEIVIPEYEVIQHEEPEEIKKKYSHKVEKGDNDYIR